MHIRILGYGKSFAYHQIGGTDSMYRRVAREWAAAGHRVEFVRYGCAEPARSEPLPNLSLHDFAAFDAALEHLAVSDGPILVNAVHRADRLRFISFRRRAKDRLRFHMVYSYFAPTLLGRMKHFFDAFLYPYNGTAWCVSPRLARAARRFRNRAEVICPPVPVDFFAEPDKKPVNKRLTVAYIGRLESGKGAADAISTLEHAAKLPDVCARAEVYDFGDSTEAEDLHRRLMANPRIACRRLSHGGWTPEVESELRETLLSADVLLLPYRSVSSSVDVPLLLLEGMAAGCCCAVPPLGDLPEIFGPSPFMMDAGSMPDALPRLLADRAALAAERARVTQRIRGLRADAPSVAARVLELLQAP